MTPKPLIGKNGPAPSHRPAPPPAPPAKKKEFGEMVNAMLADRAPTRMFELPANFFLRQRAKKELLAGRRDVRSYIKPENARDVLPHLPAAGERTHCVLRGDFVLCSIIPAVIADRGRVEHLRVASLGLSVANTDTLAGLLDRGMVGRLSVLTSTYFSAVDREDIFAHCKRELETKRGAQVAVARVHAKVLLMAAGDEHFVFEGSANLRANDGIEQMTVFNCPELHAFHAEWMDHVATRAVAGDRDNSTLA